MTVCPPPLPSYNPLAAPLTIAIAFPIVAALLVGAFLSVQQSSVLLRQRSLEPLAISCLGCVALWIAIPLRDSIGPTSFPCVAAGFFDYLSLPLLAVPLVLRLVIHDNARLERDLRTKNIGIRESQMIFEPDFSSMRAFVKRGLLGHDDEETKYKALVFAASKMHIALWVTIACAPFVIGFFVSLGTRQAWIQNCNACELGQPEAIFLVLAISLVLAGGVYKARHVSKHPDPLGLVQEFYLAFFSFYVLVLTSLILYLIDPNGVSVTQRAFNWRWIGLLGALALLYFSSAHLVFTVRFAVTLTTRAFDETDRLKDLRANKEMFNLFKEHMKKEMSDEAIKFILDVDAWKDVFKRKKEGRQREARIIYDTYIIRKARLEINIPSIIRDTLARDFNKGNVALTVFDTAYKEVVHLLMSDSLPRFMATPAYLDFISQSGSKMVVQAMPGGGGPGRLTTTTSRQSSERQVKVIDG
jgi:hypothetical protein